MRVRESLIELAGVAFPAAGRLRVVARGVMTVAATVVLPCCVGLMVENDLAALVREKQADRNGLRISRDHVSDKGGQKQQPGQNGNREVSFVQDKDPLRIFSITSS